MTSALGFSTTTSFTYGVRDSTAARPTGLQAELARVKKEYSACINCGSADTDSGQRNIEQLGIQIQQIEARIEAVSPARPALAMAPVPVGATLRETSSALGNHIDVYA